jgi:uncharacterized Fe-S cluster-containing radical SAM superfamily protein
MQPIDPILKAAQVEAIVMKGIARSYDLDKFRFQKFYGGIVTGGARGCQLDCGPCWNAERNANPSGGGAFLKPEEVVIRLEKLAGKKTDKARISGCEPILGRVSAQHLAEVIGKSRLQFVIETNGVAIGYDPEILDIFEGLDNYRIRVSLKATNGLMWEKFTGTNVWGFVYQQRGIKALVERHIRHSIAFMPRFVDYRQIDYDNPYALEDENMRFYPGTKARLLERGL